MKFRSLLAAAAIAAAAFGASAQDTYLHIYTTDTVTVKEPNQYGGYTEKQLGLFTSIPMNQVDSVRFLKQKNEFSRMSTRYNDSDGKSVRNLTFLNKVTKLTFGANPVEFHFTIPSDPTLEEVKSKVDYLDADLKINGFGVYDDFAGTAKIRGRGNSTWNWAKKAYRIKLPEKTKLCGFRKAKNYVLLANYIDLSLMRNEVAALITQLVEMPYPLHAKPVNVYLNNNYKGSYMLMEKVGINNGSVNIPAAQEAESIMFEIDTNFDEDLRVATPKFHLPLMHKDPDAPADPTEAKAWFENWTNDFNQMENAVAEGKNIGDYIDYQTLAKFLVVYNLTANQEINHPKSIYLYKTRGEKYQFGPCWDFDWAFGYSPTYRTASSTISNEEGQKLIEDAKKQFIAQYGSMNNALYRYIWYNGVPLYYMGNDDFMSYDQEGNWVVWPWGSTGYAPTYNGYLLGTGKNVGTGTAGNGGEFFMSIVMNNPEFMAAYKEAWQTFYSKIDTFWAAFDAYATELEPSAERNHTVWPYIYTTASDNDLEAYNDKTYRGAIEILRQWLKRRIEFIKDPAKNYGLYDPASTYKRGTLSTK
ncbi:MAG: CotH kinase family protein [Muribaculaceae bacterium]|nr:CotH kinase family protein [Muribaculaceae bacterium]